MDAKGVDNGHVNATVVAAFHSHKSLFRFGIVACLLTPMGVQRVADVPSEGARALALPWREGKKSLWQSGMAFILKNCHPSNEQRRTFCLRTATPNTNETRNVGRRHYKFMHSVLLLRERGPQPADGTNDASPGYCVCHVVWPSPSSFASVFPSRTTKFAPLAAAKPQPASSRRCFLPSGNVGITLADAMMMTTIVL